MFKTICPIVIGVTLTAFLLYRSFAQPPAPAPPETSIWSDLNGAPMHLDKKGKTYFIFPTVSPGVNYVTRAVAGLPAGVSLISFAYTLTTTGTPIFNYRTNPNNTCGPGSPGTVRLFIQRAGDNLSGAGVFQQYRYWSTPGVQKLAPGSFALRARFDPAQWTDIYGKPGSDFPERFRQTLQNAARVGVTFGGGCFYGHGVFNSDSDSTATFTIDAFAIE